jgi:hypothetical protein
MLQLKAMKDILHGRARCAIYMLCQDVQNPTLTKNACLRLQTTFALLCQCLELHLINERKMLVQLGLGSLHL